MSTRSSMLRWLRITLGSVFAAVDPKRRRARQAAQGAHESDRNLRHSRSAGNGIADGVVCEPIRRAEIERLLGQTRTPETAVSFLRGIAALSVPAGASAA